MSYEIFRHQIAIENNMIETYGIKVYENNKLLRTVYDVSTDFNAITKLVYLLNVENIELIHFESVLEDFYLDNV